MSREIVTINREHVFPDGRSHLLGAWRTVTGAMTRVPAPRVTLREAGHILGSASVALELPKGRVVLSGDLGRPGTPLLRDFFTGCSASVDMVVMEWT